MKAILVMEMPESCTACPLCNGSDECVVQDEDANFAADTMSDLRKGCPLVPMPARDMAGAGGEYDAGAKAGFNACLDAIEGRNT